MRAVERRGKTVEEAVAEALKDLGIDAAAASVEVIEEPAKGFLGLGAREALVRVTAVARPADVAIGLIQDVLDLMDLDGDINVEIQDPYVTVNVQGRDLGILIGRHGATLDALQFLANLAANKQAENRVKVIVDVEGYRRRREDMLSKMALRAADRVARSRHGVALEPMNPQERRIVHLALKDHPDVVTESEGEDPYRKVIVLPRE